MSGGASALAATAEAVRPFRSFWMAGFEGADHLNVRGQALDMVGTTGHADALEADYARLAPFGLRTVRESIGWRISEPRGGARFDFGRMLATARAAERRGIQVLWTLMHYGTPHDVSLLEDAFVERFVDFAAAVARILRPWHREPPVYTPINEISFLAWGACETNLFHPYVGDRRHSRYRGMPDGFEVKRRLVHATLKAMVAMRREDPRATFLHIDPLVHVVAPRGCTPALAAEAVRFREFQWQAWDMIAGRLEPELGGSPEALDRVGVNHYATSQWEFAGDALPWPEPDTRRLPLGVLLREAAQRYERPIVIAETGHVGAGRARWLHEIDAELRAVLQDGTVVDGACLYPIVDRPDWNNLAHWHRSGLWDSAPFPGHLAFAQARPLGTPPGRHLDATFAEALQSCAARANPSLTAA